MKCPKKVCKNSEIKYTARELSNTACHPVLARQGPTRSAERRAPRPLQSHGPLPTWVPSQRDKGTDCPEASTCTLTGIWFPVLMPYREFSGHGVVWGPAYFITVTPLPSKQAKLHSMNSFKTLQQKKYLRPRQKVRAGGVGRGRQTTFTHGGHSHGESNVVFPGRKSFRAAEHRARRAFHLHCPTCFPHPLPVRPQDTEGGVPVFVQQQLGTGFFVRLFLFLQCKNMFLCMHNDKDQDKT